MSIISIRRALPLHRRQLLATAGAGLVLLPGQGMGQTVFNSTPFRLGVASGDPSPDGFVIWTRLAPEPLEPHGGMPLQPVTVSWEVADDDRFKSVVAKGEALARPELAHAVHVEVGGLSPGRPYWYRFGAGRERSLPGLARTLPAAGSSPDRVRFAVAGCQHYEEGYYTAWHRIAEEDLDFVFHYGDYIYEGRGTVMTRYMNGRLFDVLRRHVGDEIYSLDDYRRRYAQYKMDPDLQAAHAAAPWFVSFDDHEVDNNWAADRDQDGTPPEIFLLRRAAALQAWYEHMPVRRRSLPTPSGIQMYRSADYGDLLRLFVLDTRQYRSDQANKDGDKPISPEVLDPARTMLGPEQEAWLSVGLEQSRARWNVLAQQVLMMHLDLRRDLTSPEPLYSMDTWSGYLPARDRLLAHIRDLGLKNVVVVTGDAHQHFAGEILLDGKPVAVEFLATSITSGSDGPGLQPGADLVLKHNPNCKLMVDKRGYTRCEVTRDHVRADLMVLDRVMVPDGKLSVLRSFVVEHGTPKLRSA